MKPQHPIFRVFTSDWKIVAILALPIFGAAMWYGVAHDYKDMGLYALAIALGSWGISSHAVLAVRKWQEWREKSRGGPGA
jgi:hypothetical protein